MRIETDEFRIGQRPIFTMSFTVGSGPGLPSTVTLKIRRPDGTVDDVALAGSGSSRTGTYDPTVPGWHVWRCVADGNGVHDAEEGRIFVHPASL